MQGDVLGQVGQTAGKSFVITFNTTPSNASVTVRDKEGKVIQPITEKIYKLKTGDYNYDIVAEGYFSKINQRLSVVEDYNETITLDKKLYVTFVLTPTNANLVVKGGNGQILTSQQDHIYELKAGMYSYSCTAENYQSVENVAFEMKATEEEKIINIKLMSSSIYGVRRQISISSTAWERISDSVDLVANANISTRAVRNDFDSIYPWSNIKTCDISANGTINAYIGDAGFSFTSPKGYIMTEVPEFWYQRKQENDYEYIYISGVEHEGFTKSKKFYIGRYTAGGSSSALTCKSGVSNCVEITISDARTAAKNIGSNWGLIDITSWSAIQMLYLVEYADYNCQTKVGAGRSSSSNSLAINTGKCDSLNMKSGYITNSNSNGVIYRGIENPWGNIYQWLDGINITYRRVWISRKPSDYVSDKFTSPYTNLGYVNCSSNGYISKVGYDANNPDIQLPIEASGSDATKIPDFYSQGSSKYVVSVGGCYNADAFCGLWCWSCDYPSTYAYMYYGCRLLYIPT